MPASPPPPEQGTREWGQRPRLAAALTVLALIGGGLAWGSGLDRASAAVPGLAELAPERLRAAAWRTGAAVALSRDDSRGALAAARAAVAADPGDAGGASLLGTARLATGDAVGAEAAFRVAASLGWRDRATQVYWLAAGLQLGEPRIAAQRADALLRQDPNLAQAPQVLAPLEADPAGRRALAERLALRPPWFGAYLTALSGITPAQLAGRALVLSEPALARSGIACAQVGGLVAALYAARRPAEARRLSAASCGDTGLLRDGTFQTARLDGAAPFSWTFPGAGGLDVRLERTGPGTGQTVVVGSALPLRQVFAAQAVQLEPGRYRLQWRARDATGAASPRVAARLTCRRFEGAFAATVAQGSARYAASVEAPQDCPLPWIELAIVPGAGATRVDEVSLARAGGGGA